MHLVISSQPSRQRLHSLWRGLASARRPLGLLDLLALPPETPREEVRRSYLREVLRVHPDNSSDPEATRRTIELQEAWEIYRRRRSHHDGNVHSGFTQFGVGCSFDDSAEEQRIRAEVTEQASRGALNQRAFPTASGESD